MTQPIDPLMNASAVRAALGGVASMTLWRWVRAGVLPPPVKLQNRNYWYRSAIERVGQTREQGAAA